MLTLYLLRHAKAATPTAGMDDKDRPLNETGREACQQLGMYMSAHKIVPQKILCSSAVRTRETHALVMAAAGQKPDTQFVDKLYLATTGEMLAMVQKTPADVKSLMVIAHNPGTHNLALKLAHEGPPDAVQILEEKYPTCSLAVLKFKASGWDKLTPDSGTLMQFLTPKTLDE